MDLEFILSICIGRKRKKRTRKIKFINTELSDIETLKCICVGKNLKEKCYTCENSLDNIFDKTFNNTLNRATEVKHCDKNSMTIHIIIKNFCSIKCKNENIRPIFYIDDI